MYRCFSLLILIALFLPTSSFATSVYTVRLTNGNVLEANSYSVKNGKVYLLYPVGEAAIPLNQVVSIIGDGGSADLLQSKGESIPHTELKTSATASVATPRVLTTSNLQPKTPISGAPNNINNTSTFKEIREQIDEKTAAIQQTVSRSKPVNAYWGDNYDYDPVADALVQQLATADEKKAEEIGNQLNTIFDATNEANVGDAESR